MAALQEVLYSTRMRRKRGLPSMRPFYAPISPSLINGNIDPECDLLDGAFRTPLGAIRYARLITAEHGSEVVIYKLVPVATVTPTGIAWIDEPVAK